MRRLASLGLELDGGVVNLEVVPEGVVDAFEDRAAIRKGHLGDRYMAGKGVAA